MQLAIFKEVLNGLINYFILGDVVLLATYKIARGLPDDLATELTTTELGEELVNAGILIPMIGIENYPYTVIFHDHPDSVQLSKPGNNLQFHKPGYVCRVEHGEVYLYTWHILNNFTNAAVSRMVEQHREQQRPVVELENGWYSLEIFGGLTEQEMMIMNVEGNAVTSLGPEPTLEFVLQRMDEALPFGADLHFPFRIEC